ncbi:phage tail tape measure protein, TP901 family, core region [Oceanobacillus picturae]|uniref:Phage tail tape measure protein, TP901 family, core region n=1 Tax=Oceanobacillus picturae TaxID=171693 RepID=W9B9C2_9BACI|nr:phage tail tape measure protein [Oceanobacillus picturae]CDO03095.1 phage tail tape measure protein, TP901 family, core region [Oceanobacillus picturae]
MAERDVGNLRTRLSWEDDGAASSLTGFKRDLKGLRSEMNAARSGGKEYTNSLKGLRQQSDILTRRFKTQEQQVKELRKRYEESRRVKGEDAKQTKNLSDQYNNARAAMNRTENQLKDVTSEIEKQINPWKRLSSNMTSAGDKMQTIGRGMTDFGRNYSMKVTTPIVASGVAVFKAASDYESAFAGVEKTVDGTAEQMQGLRQAIRDMAKEIPSSTTEIAKVAEAAGQLGIKTESIEEFTKTMINLGEATNMSSDQAATEFARFANIVGMSQDDFDKLGSTVVALGNNLATTESEISSMAMRLAGAGKQVGMSEADIMSFAAALSSVGIEAEAGGSAFSKVMVEMQLAAEKGGDSLDNFAKVAGMSSSDFKKAYQEDATGAISKFIEGLATAEDRGLSAIGILDDMGIKEVRLRDSLLRAAGASDVFSEALNIGSKAWEENTALTEEAEKRYATTESQLKMMWNRIKDVGITLGEALIPAVMDAIDAAEPLIQKIEEGVQAFADMDEEQQQTILKMIALAAAIGPVSVVLGSMTSTIGGLLKIGGSLTGLLGKVGGKGGAGLLGKFGLMGLTGGPVGLAIAGVAGLTLGIAALNSASQVNLEEMSNNIEKRREEIDQLDETIARYDELRGKNKLSTDEVLRYMDIMDELKDAKSEETIKRLSDEQATLAEKSGMSKDELNEFLTLNDTLVEKTPEVAEAISEQGNAYAGTADEAQRLNDIERERLTADLYTDLSEQMDEQVENLLEQAELAQEINHKTTERNGHNQAVIEATNKIRDIDKELRDINDDQLGLTIEQRDQLRAKREQLESEKLGWENIIDDHKIHLADLDKDIDKKKTSKKEIDKQVDAYNTMLNQYESMLLQEQGIVDEKGNAYESIKDANAALDKQRTELIRQHDANEINTKEYDKQRKKIDDQVKAINGVQTEADVLNDMLKEDIKKSVDVSTNPSASALDRSLASTIYKRVNIDQRVHGNAMLGYASGTPAGGHRGGVFEAGEEGWELGRMGNRWEMLTHGFYERPRGYQVFPHDESKQIMRTISALNKTPGYATGARPPGEANRVIDELGNQPKQLAGEAVIYTTVVNQMDGREISRQTYKHTTEFQERDKKVRERFA